MAEPEKDLAGGLTRARAGLSEALGEVLESCRGFLLDVAERELDAGLRAKGGASDVVQQTMLDALRDFEHFQGGSEAELRAWLQRMLRHNLVDFARLYRDTGKRLLERERPLPDDSGLIGDASSPSARAIGNEQHQAIQQAMARLPEDYRRVLHMRYQEQCSFDEIGRQLELSPNAARKLWNRALKRLQEETEGPS